MRLNSRGPLHAFLVLVAVAFAWPGAARAACNGAVLTANTTNYWTYVRVLDPTKTVVLDSGFIAPHTTKSWNGAPARSLCGFPLNFQYQVSSATGATAPATIGNPIADVAAKAPMLLPASLISTALNSVPTAQTTLPFWLSPGDTGNAIRATTGALNALSCLKTADNRYFAVDDSTYCANAPVARPPSPPMPEVAGCGTIVTLNQTDHWVWITIYPLDHQEHYDWGPVAPHNFRAWHAGGAPTPMSYMCGSFYYVRYEVRAGRNQAASEQTYDNTFDTTMQINPQLSLGEILKLVVSAGKTLRCVTSPASGVECAADWGMDEAAGVALFGMVGSEAQGSVVCLKSSDDTSFWLENTSNCANPPPNGKVRPPGPPPNPYALEPSSRTMGIGSNARTWYFAGTKNGVASAGGTYSTDDPKIAKFLDSHNGHSLHGLKAGKTNVHWSVDGKVVASGTVTVK